MKRQPNSDYCFVCGRKNEHGLRMAFYDNGRDQVFADYTVDEAYQGFPGVVHGGIVAAMLDEVVGRVAMIGDHHHFMMSVKLQVKYRQPTPTAVPLRIVGQLVKLRGRLGQATGAIHLPDGSICADAAMTLADLPEQLRPNSNLAELGWYVDGG